ncbi:MAG: hypothetical protein J2P33_12350 [Actinobacteria bacterium]|nr:hypothetical protein [Actinomycetota bacterium]
MVALPVMELAFPSHMPALLILLGPPLVVLMAGIERTYIDAPAVAQVSSGLVFGTVLAIPVLDLVVVFAHEHGPVVRSTLGMVYGIGSAFSIGALLIARRIDTTDLWLAALLTVPVVIGFGAGRLLLPCPRSGVCATLLRDLEY